MTRTALTERVFALLPELRSTASVAWRERPHFGCWRAASDSFVYYDVALRIAAQLARELPDVSIFPYRTADEAAVQIGESGVGVLIIVRGRLLNGFVDLEVKLG